MNANETQLDSEHHVVVAMFDAHPIAMTTLGELRAAGFTEVRVTQGAPESNVADAHVWDEVERSFGGEDRDLYAEGARRGAALVIVDCGRRCDLAASILEKNLPVDIEERARTWGIPRGLRARPKKPVRLRVVRRTQTIAESIRAIEVLAQDLEVDYGQRATRGVSFERFKPAYEYGRELASADTRGWDAIEQGVRDCFEQRNPGLWTRYRDAVRRGYERALVRRGSRAPAARAGR